MEEKTRPKRNTNYYKMRKKRNTITGAKCMNEKTEPQPTQGHVLRERFFFVVSSRAINTTHFQSKWLFILSECRLLLCELLFRFFFSAYFTNILAMISFLYFSTCIQCTLHLKSSIFLHICMIWRSNFILNAKMRSECCPLSFLEHNLCIGKRILLALVAIGTLQLCCFLSLRYAQLLIKSNTCSIKNR